MDGFRKRTVVRFRSEESMAEECLANLPTHRPVVVTFPAWLCCVYSRVVDSVSCQDDLASNEGSCRQ